MIKITDEEFPVVSVVRRKKPIAADTAVYFGPYTDAALLRVAMKELRKIFGFRSCRKMPKIDCLYSRLGLCPAPCIGKISAARYRENVRLIKLFLESKVADLIDDLADKMRKSSRKTHFEEAAQIRDQIDALSVIAGYAQEKSAANNLEDLKNLLGLKDLPRRIEAFDVSNISGKEATASMVSFYQGRPDKSNYRRFRIKTVDRVDDYGMLREAVGRRYRRLVREKQALPDLVLIDGGRGHLLTAQEEIKKLGIQIPLVSIAKDKENIYIPSLAGPLTLNSDTPALNLIRKVRDEAHRFARAYHLILRRKKIIGR